MARKQINTKPESAGENPISEEQIAKRQSAPRSSATDYAIMMGAGKLHPEDGSVDGFAALANPIGREAVLKATTILNRYKGGKANLESRIVENEQWYKLRHWECMRKKEPNMVEPVSAWLLNSILNKHADAMDNFPSPNVLPREEGDKPQAEMLSSILPVILDMNDFEKTYSEVQMYKMKTGTGVYGVFWDAEKNYIGDVSVKKIDLLSLFWEPGIMDIQQSKHLFNVELVDNDTLISMYPQLQGKLSTATIDVAKYVFDDTVDTSEKSVVVDWYYKKRNSQGKQILHFCKYVNDVVLYATENNPEMAESGLYDHGKYPFVFDPLFASEGTPTGFGYIDIGKSPQEYIDRINQAILQNTLANARPRHFIRNDGTINETEYMDLTKDLVHVEGNLSQDSIMPIMGKPLSDIYVSVVSNKIEELKETTGNRDVSTGGTTSGVTAGSAIAAMQEASSKLSRSSSKASYRCFREVCLLCIELIRQFYDLPRAFRIMGNNGAEKFVMFSNAGIVPQAQGIDFGMDMGMRIPLFDIEVSAQKQSPYSKMAQNELALQFYQAGFFNPQMADQALACLDMMDFDRKDFVMNKISENGGMLQQMMMLAQMADQAMGTGGELTANIAMQYGMPAPAVVGSAGTDANEALGGEASKENKLNQKARQRVAESTDPT